MSKLTQTVESLRKWLPKSKAKRRTSSGEWKKVGFFLSFLFCPWYLFLTSILTPGDEEALTIWRKYRDLSLAKYKQEYNTLNVDFDVYWGESKVGKYWQNQCVTKGEELGIVETVDGAKLVNLEKYKLGKAILLKRGKCVDIFVDIFYVNHCFFQMVLQFI